MLSLTVACRETVDEPRPTAPPPQTAVVAAPVLPTPQVRKASTTRSTALVGVTPTYGLPPDLAVTATALYSALNATAPPPSPRTGGGEHYGATPEVDLRTGDAALAAATAAPPPPRTGGGGEPDLFAPGAQALYSATNTESYAEIVENDFRDPGRDPLSTLSIDVDTAAYSNVRRMIDAGRWPPADAVRLEELVNYFGYEDPAPAPEDPVPFAVQVEVAGSPWTPGHRLVRLGLRGREVDRAGRPPVNLVFLIDVSGSMQTPEKLPLVKESLGLLVDQLDEEDRVAMVVYAGAAGLVLPSTRGNARAKIHGAIERLEAGGSTNGGAGIKLAYDTALDAFLADGVNRVVLATDGDFNVGLTDTGALTEYVADRAEEGVALTAVGFGMGNFKDDRLEQLSNRGDGNYAYIDSPQEAEKVSVDEVMGTLVTIARDVKLQVEFNPVEVGAYRLLGYENRVLASEDFNDDAVDAGEVGAGHTLTVLYEIVPPGMPLPSGEAGEAALAESAPEGVADDVAGETGVASDAGAAGVDPLRYQEPMARTEVADSGELLSVKIRWKAPQENRSTLLTVSAFDYGLTFEEASADLRFAAAVAGFGMVLRDSAHRGEADLPSILRIARAATGADPSGLRAGFVSLAERALLLRESQDPERVGMLGRGTSP
jgi:Ca-activated chloride channel family protein